MQERKYSPRPSKLTGRAELLEKALINGICPFFSPWLYTIIPKGGSGGLKQCESGTHGITISASCVEKSQHTGEQYRSVVQNMLLWGGESWGYETLCQYLATHGQALTFLWKGEIPVLICQDYSAFIHLLLPLWLRVSLSAVSPISSVWRFVSSSQAPSHWGTVWVCAALPEAAVLLGGGCWVSLACLLYTQPPVNTICKYHLTPVKCLCACWGPSFPEEPVWQLCLAFGNHILSQFCYI